MVQEFLRCFRWNPHQD
ncbi:hypothetical protein Goshw_025555 [Gossypium schwendimanii]|uniref:Uncharacterized protein n=1 Tax=Gossypium schwendimanii TaxID=34291 RepID=A0A7J9LR54_GOSSC|nr:hypothetical protein [Gossypium schwendimanii]